jgi:hypothetical protein
MARARPNLVSPIPEPTGGRKRKSGNLRQKAGTVFQHCAPTRTCRTGRLTGVSPWEVQLSRGVHATVLKLRPHSKDRAASGRCEPAPACGFAEWGHVTMANKAIDGDRLIPDRDILAEFNINPMTLWRWDRDPRLAALGWPPPIRINRRKYRSQRQKEKFTAALIAARTA